MDFGIAKALEEVHRELTANLFLGKFEYASPEQCGFGLERGESIDWRSDIYSLGVTPLQDDHRPPPLQRGHAAGLPGEARHRGSAPAFPDRSDAGLPVELDRLVLRALAKSRSDRPSRWPS